MQQSRRSADAERVRILVGLMVALGWLLAGLAGSQALLNDPDIWWHLKTGQWILQHRAFPVTDPFSHSFAGQPWIAKEWLAQVVFATGFGAAGWNGVVLLAAASMAMGAWLLYLALSEELKPSHAAVAACVALALAAGSFVARPHLLTLPLFIFWAWQVFRASWLGRAPAPALLVLVMLWANLHAGYTLGFAIAGLAFLDFVERTRLADRREFWKWLVFLVLCPLASLIHPYGWLPLLPSWTVISPAEAAIAISEWRPFDAQGYPLEEGGLLLLALLALVSGFRLGLARAVLVLLLLHLYLAHMRFGFYFYPITLIVIAPELARQFPRLSAAAWREEPRDAAEALLARRFRPLAGVLGAVLLVLGWLQASVLPAAPSEEASASAAISYALAHGLTGKVFNDYDLGGPLIFNGIPTFIDGRTDQLFRAGGFSVKFGFGPTEPREMADTLRQYDIRWTLLRPSDVRATLMDKLPGWRRIYADDHAVIHQLEDARASLAPGQ